MLYHVLSLSLLVCIICLGKMLSYIICFCCVHSSVPHVNYFPLVLYKRAALRSLEDFWGIAVIITFHYSVPVNLCEIAAAPSRPGLHWRSQQCSELLRTARWHPNQSFSPNHLTARHRGTSGPFISATSRT